jgi:16S rRNA C967 or C1407 C5-methylase (RsmB/RsmF family)
MKVECGRSELESSKFVAGRGVFRERRRLARVERRGEIYLQDEASQLVAQIVDVKPASACWIFVRLRVARRR